MKPTFILVLILFLLSCTSYGDRYDKDYGILKPFYLALDDYPEKAIINILEIENRDAFITGDNEKIKSAKQKAEAEMNKLTNYLSQHYSVIDIPFKQNNKNKYEIISIKTKSVLPFNSIDFYPFIEIEIKYKVLKKLLKFDFMYIECIDKNDYCFASKHPSIEASGVLILPIKLDGDWGSFRNFVFQ